MKTILILSILLVLFTINSSFALVTDEELETLGITRAELELPIIYSIQIEWINKNFDGNGWEYIQYELVEVTELSESSNASALGKQSFQFTGCDWTENEQKRIYKLTFNIEKIPVYVSTVSNWVGLYHIRIKGIIIDSDGDIIIQSNWAESGLNAVYQLLTPEIIE